MVFTRRKFRRKSRGIILMDALFGIAIFVLGALAFYGLMPVIHRSQEIAQQESKAAQIVARVTEELSMLKPSQVTTATLTQIGVIDAGQTAAPWTFSNIPLDDGTSYSPAKMLRNGKGTISIATIDKGSVLATVTLTWRSPSGKSESLTAGTVVGGYR